MMFLQLGAIPTLVISSADAAVAIFKGLGSGHDLAFSGRPTDLYVVKKISYDLNNISFAPYAITELLSSKRVQSFRTIREEEIAAIVNHIDIASSSSAPYGSRGDGGTSRFYRVLHEIPLLLEEFVVSDYLLWMWWVNKLNGMETRVEKNFKELDKLYDEVIADHEDIVDVLLQLQKDARQLITLNNQQIKGVLMDMFIAGTDTTSSALVWTFIELIRNPPLMEKVKYEVRKVGNGRDKIEESDIPKLHYLHSVIKETLRLHPPVLLLVPRETTKNCAIEYYEIPAKTRVIINAKSIGTDPKYLENPHEFRPDIFMTSSVDFKGQHLEFLPFGVGQRGCPGTSFAIMLLHLTVANFLNRFDWELPKGMSVEDKFQTKG
ncbi:hypothetical protein CXB51_018203 [Gossypium anomalum]|uniref:Cytochrome P450 n=1 Tax=Gossypium anomalum TaxID=47600 RepID=A0A8J5YQ16_9ROSI|nr:hypothetical protein CXB51_018203 [Gossypium anomalum]